MGKVNFTFFSTNVNAGAYLPTRGSLGYSGVSGFTVLSGSAKGLRLVSACGSVFNQKAIGNTQIAFPTLIKIAFPAINPNPFIDKTLNFPNDNNEFLILSPDGTVSEGLEFAFPLFDQLSEMTINIIGFDNGAAQAVGDTINIFYTLVFEEIF